VPGRHRPGLYIGFSEKRCCRTGKRTRGHERNGPAQIRLKRRKLGARQPSTRYLTQRASNRVHRALVVRHGAAAAISLSPPTPKCSPAGLLQSSSCAYPGFAVPRAPARKFVVPPASTPGSSVCVYVSVPSVAACVLVFVTLCYGCCFFHVACSSLVAYLHCLTNFYGKIGSLPLKDLVYLGLYH
jgi:hypothetical protein